MIQTKVVEKIKTYFMAIKFFLGNIAFCETMWKNIVERGKDTDDNMTHAHCMLDN